MASRVTSAAADRPGRLVRLLAAWSLPWLAAAAACGYARAQDVPAKCQLVRIAEWPVRMVRGKILLDGTINGRKIGAVIDTGAAKTLILRSSAERLGLALKDVHGVRMYGVGGATRLQAAELDEITLGGVTRKGMQVFVAGENDLSSWGDLVLGEDFLGRVDVEFDLAHDAVRLFEPKGCEGVSLAYWASDGGLSVDFKPLWDVDPHIVLEVAINGMPVEAMLDSGAGISIVDSTFARRAGVAGDASTATRSDKLRGLGGQTTDAWKATFATFEIGSERIRDAELVVADFRRVHEERTGSHISTTSLRIEPMVLGADFIRAHRLLVSHSKHRLYFTYVGGPVFGGTRPPAGPQGPTREREPAR
jgi:clan AA aspartic protease (TIGR02281 family)